ncbi:hypothetical protein AMELA_G00248580 [Ameiurus melas]|uniref:Uncharacterized protein n=1 Tax=Ameiurus melas TaxID=219545 RepID=A0A7J5ZXC6_AMEME|nr:hypothetical protein AMELA_G00248580 [Ameiurus melas]
MSRSNSTGDLVPKDIMEMLALQNKITKSRKKRGSSLSRTFSWFKGSKPKRIVSNGQSRSGRLGDWTGECTTTRQDSDDYDVSKAGQKKDEQTKLTVHYTASQHYQENVFIEGSRPKYLEDLHTEAQEGLKILQEEYNIAKDLEEDRPVSTVTAQQDNYVNCEERDGNLRFDSTADHSITSVSIVSAVSSRPVLTRQGSTFKPLNTVKRLDNPRKRSRRTTIMGIPQQVQRELSMGRGCLLQLPTDDDDSSGRIIIPTIDGEVPITNHEGARVHLQDIEALQISRDDQLLRHHIRAVYKDDFLLNIKFGQQISQRPRSLAVPGITTSSALLQEPQGPVMSISPQATYLSTVIPNAILPSAIDVIEIDRSCNRRSVRTVSKSSLAPASPASSRSGGGTHDEPNSTSSKWSHSQSSETIVSHTSTLSFKGSIPCSHVTDSMKEVTDLNEEQMSFKSSVSWSSYTSKAGSQRLEQGELSDAAETAQNSRLFSRNLSVMKAKLPPAPPRRTYSLHLENLKQRPRELGGKKDLKYLGSNGRQMDADLNMKEGSTLSYTENMSTQSPLFDESKLSVTASPLKPVEAQSESPNSSPQDIFERTLSPSSGYSSQSGTPTHSSKDICPTSPGKQRLKPPKPERTVTRISPAVSVSSSLVSLSSNVSDPANQLTQTHTTQSQPPKISPATTTLKNKVIPLPTANLRELFNIPPPPKEEEVQPEMEQKLLTLEHSWPPPPPPLDESSDLVFEGHDEIDFPPPPPPGMQESFIVISEHYKMVRLRTVNVEEQVNLLSQEDTAGTETTPDQDLSVSSQVTPQKPVRKSMQSPVKSSSASLGPSMRLQEAIRMKTAAMSSSGFPARTSLRLPTPTANGNDMPALSPKTPDDCKSPASTASFIFSKSTKKVVIETATSPEAQASLKQSLAAELMQISDHNKSMVTNGTKKHHKVPPPVAKKPVHVTSPSEKLGTVTKLTIVGSSMSALHHRYKRKDCTVS